MIEGASGAGTLGSERSKMSPGHPSSTDTHDLKRRLQTSAAELTMVPIPVPLN